jgi:hypothetical protein
MGSGDQHAEPSDALHTAAASLPTGFTTTRAHHADVDGDVEAEAVRHLLERRVA